MSKEAFGLKNFEEWFHDSGCDEQYKETFGAVWDAALEQASKYVGQCEGTDFDLYEELKA